MQMLERLGFLALAPALTAFALAPAPRGPGSRKPPSRPSDLRRAE